MWLAISKPCGYLNDDYLIRNVTIPQIYDAQNGDCKYTNADSTHFHTLFSPTSFSDTEYNVYNENGMLGNIQSHVFNYDSSYFYKNNYSLYYKPFSLWA